MAVVVQDKHGWLLDQKRFIDSNYCQKEIENKSQSETKLSNFQFKQVSFDIFTPFKLDSQFVKYIDIQSGKDTFRKNKRKRKRVNTNNDDISNDDDNLHTKLREAYQSITNCVSKVNYFMKQSDLPLDNNIAARELARSIRDIDVVGLLPEGVGEGEGRTVTYLSGPRMNVSASDVANRLVHVAGTEPTDTCIMSLHRQKYVLPSNSSFLWSDIHLIHTLKDIHETYDLIVLDPPWENKSAKRKKSYWSVDNETLLDLPIPSLAAPGALIVMWVTENRRHQQFVTQSLFPHWSVKHVATWHWLKVTRGGELVTELDNSHKKPYETILIGQYCPADVDLLTTNVPDERVVMSVPSAHHSQKPCLFDVLASHLPSPSRRLELFARNLLPGWTSWGNEVFKYQHMSLFEEITAKDT